tara:strand:+ start:941 stop:1249 length:309 start_codon:yes stop_codon:yes gene_type:complete
MTATIIALVSVGINIFLLFYIRWLLRSMTFISENMDGLWVLIEQFRQHVDMLHETEMFYGDSNLQALMEHSKKVTEEIDSYKLLLLPEEEIETDGEYIEDDS